ncbi:MAG: NAD(P)-binding domain-containing protein, partial [Candidatus Pacebacteria bacterium]|nr:NAD(P)-binding domain-containing protein [Candidatus Paceibacterota bacterium]
MQRFETIIVGAGPAGLIAGKYLENAIILEQKKEIGRPVQCVGMSTQSLERQGIEPSPVWTKSTIYKVERITPNGKIIGKTKEKPLGYVVEKAGFEKHLATKIKAKLVLETKVINIKRAGECWQVITDRGEIFQSKYVIAADGFNSIIRQKIFPEVEQRINTEFAIEYSIELENPIDIKTVKIYLDNQIIKNGYAWVFPTSQYTVNIGTGGSAKNSIALLEKFMQTKILNKLENYK